MNTSVEDKLKKQEYEIKDLTEEITQLKKDIYSLV